MSWSEDYPTQRKRTAPAASFHSASAASTPKAALPAFAKGDMVRHDTFGTGMILSALPVGNDMMLEIAFDQVGTKRLMAKAASVRMKKL